MRHDPFASQALAADPPPVLKSKTVKPAKSPKTRKLQTPVAPAPPVVFVFENAPEAPAAVRFPTLDPAPNLTPLLSPAWRARLRARAARLAN